MTSQFRYHKFYMMEDQSYLRFHGSGNETVGVCGPGSMVKETISASVSANDRVNANFCGIPDFSEQLIPKTCEELFVCDKCNECQSHIWTTLGSESSCGFTASLIKKVVEKYVESGETEIDRFDMTFYDESVKELCDAEFKCTYEEAEPVWKETKTKCASELATLVDWTLNPSAIDKTVAYAYGIVLIYYFGIPDHDFICHESSSGELCGIEAAKAVLDWLKEAVPDGDFVFSYDYSFVYKSDGTQIEVPQEFKCSECSKVAFEIYFTWPEQHQLDDDLVKNLFGSWEDFKQKSSCPNPEYSAKMKLKRALNRLPRRSAGNAGFSPFMAADRLKI
ncbi:4874_t:CDS:2 [Funneliformis caledonium]|uniref:4874_t:CDS:1 n=1 Tax=Funneliformis caledonium TaxID=1117310 RepID=A0A9N9GWM8_9GLOM|nr:4874_t:CDS:2 [Funneliformis caledonium]